MTGTFLLYRQWDKAFWMIVAAVVGGHIIALAALAVQFALRSPQVHVVPRRVVVKTVDLRPKVQQTSRTPAQTSPPSPVVKKEASKPVKKAARKETTKPVEKSASKAKKEKLAAPTQESISKIQESLRKINTKPLEPMPDLSIPNSLVALAVDTIPDAGEADLPEAEAHYRDELARRLRGSLILPERGEVVMKLTLGRQGNVARFSIVSSPSQANKKYVEQKVPGLTFPSFGSYFGGEAQHTFTIALRSE